VAGMVSLFFIGVVTALAMLAILAKTCAGRPKKAEKWEKSEILRQLLTLSERENGISAVASPSARSPRPASASATRRETMGKFAQQHDSKRKYSAASRSSRIPSKPNQPDADLEEQIRQRAFELYQARGGTSGNPSDDWEQARQEVLNRKAKAATTSS
jgi:hypothetical protein